eukprot:4173094-Alexandrium_andersonii.AAC.1
MAAPGLEVLVVVVGRQDDAGGVAAQRKERHADGAEERRGASSVFSVPPLPAQTGRRQVEEDWMNR